MKTLFFVLASIILAGINFNQKHAIKKEQKIIYITTLGRVDSTKVVFVKKSIESFYGFRCEFLAKSEISGDILSPSKKRCDANKILKKFKGKTNVLVLTESDISHERGKNPEYGIIGLGYCPGKVCVVSTYRIKRGASEKTLLDRLKKVTLHEIGHNLGMPHCESSSKSCLMNDARGTAKTIDREQVELCKDCSRKIKH